MLDSIAHAQESLGRATGGGKASFFTGVALALMAAVAGCAEELPAECAQVEEGAPPQTLQFLVGGEITRAAGAIAVLPEFIFHPEANGRSMGDVDPDSDFRIEVVSCSSGRRTLPLAAVICAPDTDACERTTRFAGLSARGSGRFLPEWLTVPADAATIRFLVAGREALVLRRPAAPPTIASFTARAQDWKVVSDVETTKHGWEIAFTVAARPGQRTWYLLENETTDGRWQYDSWGPTDDDPFVHHFSPDGADQHLRLWITDGFSVTDPGTLTLAPR